MEGFLSQGDPCDGWKSCTIEVKSVRSPYYKGYSSTGIMAYLSPDGDQETTLLIPAVAQRENAVISRL